MIYCHMSKSLLCIDLFSKIGSLFLWIANDYVKYPSNGRPRQPALTAGYHNPCPKFTSHNAAAF